MILSTTCMLRAYALLTLAHLPLPKLQAVKLTFHPEFSVFNVFLFYDVIVERCISKLSN